MRKYILLCIALLAMLLPVGAQALTELEWNLRCGYKLNTTATLYECYLEETVASGSDLPTETYRFDPIGSLGAGTYVKMASNGIQDKAEIIYYSNGSKLYAYVDRSAVSSAVVTVTTPDGEKYAVPEVCYANPDTWYMVLSENFGGTTADKIIAAMRGGAGGGEGDGGYVMPVAQSGSVRLVSEDGEEQAVTLVTLGTAVSEVQLEKEKLTVPTASLRWDTTADEDEMLAVIKAHKGGEASLRIKANTKSACIEKIQTNRIVLVLEKGKKFTKVLHEGKIGYIINTALTYYPVGGVKEGDAEPVPGWVSFRGKTKSRNTINIRQNGKNGSRVLTDFIAGTPIMVFSQEGKWSEIDVGGYRAYILTEYVTLDTGEETEE